MGISGVGVFLQAFSLADVLYQWEGYGVFDLLLPFLLIFAVIFGVLSTTAVLGKNKGILMIISLVIALMSLRLEFVTLFFTGLFPRFAMGLIVLLIGLIMVGLFIPQEKRALKGWYTFFGIVGVIIALVAVLQTFSSFDYFGSEWWQEYTTVFISAIAIVAVLIGIVLGVNPTKDKDPDRFKPYVLGPLRKDDD